MDFTTDHNPTALYLADELIEFPSFVKDAAVLSKDDISNLADIAFADKLNREYPIHTKEATFLSAVYKQGNQEADDTVYEEILKSAKYFGIEEEVSGYEEVIALHFDALNKSASTHEYALTIDFGDFKSRGAQNYYPIESDASLRKSANALVEDVNANKLPFSIIRAACQNMVKAATDYNTELPSFIVENGGEACIDFDKANDLIQSRLLVKGATSESIKAYQEILDTAKSDPTNASAYLDAMADLDTALGVKYASSGIPTPHEILFSGPKETDLEKFAAAHLAINDIMVPVNEFNKLDADSIERNFSEKVASVIKEAKSADRGTAQASLDSLTANVQSELLALLLRASDK